MDDRLAGQVAKRHVVEVHGALRVANGLDGLARGGVEDGGLFLLRRVQELEHALRACRHLLQHVRYGRKLRDGLSKVLNVLDERLDVARLDRTVHGKARAHHDDADVAHVAHEAHERLHEAGKELALPRALVQQVVLLLEVLDGALAAIERLDNHLAGEVLLDAAVHGAELLLLQAEVALRPLDEHTQNQRGHRQRHERHARERKRDRDHHHRDAHDLRDGGHQLDEALVKRLAQRVHVVCHAREHVALRHGAAVEVRERHARDLLRNLPAHAVHDLLRHAGHDPALHARRRGARQVYA